AGHVAAEVRHRGCGRRTGAAQGEAGNGGRGAVPQPRPAPDADALAAARRCRGCAPARFPGAWPDPARGADLAAHRRGGGGMSAAAAMPATGGDAPVTEARMLEIVFPDHTNHLGTLFGGQALAWMDKAAFIAASRFARRTVVTARSEQVDFRLPIRQGQLVETIARVVEVGRTSMQVEVDVVAEDLLS